MNKKQQHIRFVCHFGGKRDNQTIHNATMNVRDIGKWMEAYIYTHPNVRSITAKVWPQDEGVEV